MDVEPLLQSLDGLLEGRELQSFTYSRCFVDFSAFSNCARNVSHLNFDLGWATGAPFSKNALPTSGFVSFTVSATSSELPRLLSILTASPKLRHWSLAHCDHIPDLSYFPDAISKIKSIYFPWPSHICTSGVALLANPDCKPTAMRIKCSGIEKPVLDWLEQTKSVESFGIILPQTLEWSSFLHFLSKMLDIPLPTASPDFEYTAKS